MKRCPSYVSDSSLPFSSLSSKTLLALIPLLLLSYSFNTQALSATSANTIKGSAPYIETNGVKATNLSSLLSIKIGTKTYISDSSGRMKEVGAGGALSSVSIINLANIGDALSSVSTLVPADTTTYALNSAIPANAQKDDDNDGPFTIQGSVKGEWFDKNNTSIGNNLSTIPKICSAPYVLILTASGSPSISSPYGDPKITMYGNTSVKFKINPASQPAICYAKPELQYGTPPYAGSSSMWDPTNGFIPQSTNPVTYGNNFPTTGANNLYFDLDIGGVPAALTWPVVQQNGIKATMTPNVSGTSVRVKLTGPTATATGLGTFPLTFELIGQNSSGSTPVSVVKYGFVLRKWYAITSTSANIAPNASATCTGSGFRLPNMSELTNAIGTAGGNGGTIPTPSKPSSGNWYTRTIGAGLFSEWGATYQYTGSGFLNKYYWVIDLPPGYNKFAVQADGGSALSVVSNSYTGYGVCIYP